MSHGLLVAVLMALGGSIELEGRTWPLQPLSSSQFRLAVVNSQPAAAPEQ